VGLSDAGGFGQSGVRPVQWQIGRENKTFDRNRHVKTTLDIGLVVTSVMLIVLVLLHRGKGGGLSSLFGGGVQSSLSGSSVVERNLDRLTVFVGVIWLIFILGIGLDIKLS
jgi:preprotein translocase subunit SecG